MHVPIAEGFLIRAASRLRVAVGLSIAWMMTHCDRYDVSDRTEYVAAFRTSVMLEQLAIVSAWSGPPLTAMMPGLPKAPAVIIGWVLRATSREIAGRRESMELWARVLSRERPDWD
jgi:hypothetical protein